MTIRLLVADDDPLIRTLIAVSLADVAEVVEADDGDSTLALFDRNEFDVVVLDWEMPGTSGLDVLKTIRQRPSTVPVIMITAKNERGQILKAVHAGASDYLIKPFKGGLLREKLAKLCPATTCARR